MVEILSNHRSLPSLIQSEPFQSHLTSAPFSFLIFLLSYLDYSHSTCSWRLTWFYFIIGKKRKSVQYSWEIHCKTPSGCLKSQYQNLCILLSVASHSTPTNFSNLRFKIFGKNIPGRLKRQYLNLHPTKSSFQNICCLVTQSCLTLCDPMDCSTAGFPVLHHLPEFTQTHVH